jgi:hypothetical protein
MRLNHTTKLDFKAFKDRDSVDIGTLSLFCRGLKWIGAGTHSGEDSICARGQKEASCWHEDYFHLTIG